MTDIDTQIEEILNNHYLLNGGRNLGQYKIEYDCSCGEILLEDGHAQDNTSNIKLVLNTHKTKAIKALLIQQKGGYATPEEAKQPEATKSVTDSELHSLKDRAHLFELVYDAPCYITFFAGSQGQGGAFRETMIVANRDHNDNTLYNMAMRKAKKLGATSWVVFKPIGVPHDVYYGQHGDESRLDFIEIGSDLVVDDPEANWDAANPPSKASLKRGAIRQ